jgi:hypothetical protein
MVLTSAQKIQEQNLGWMVEGSYHHQVCNLQPKPVPFSVACVDIGK